MYIYTILSEVYGCYILLLTSCLPILSSLPLFTACSLTHPARDDSKSKLQLTHRVGDPKRRSHQPSGRSGATSVREKGNRTHEGGREGGGRVRERERKKKSSRQDHQKCDGDVM